jgi:hypothetical protein
MRPSRQPQAKPDPGQQFVRANFGPDALFTSSEKELQMKELTSTVCPDSILANTPDGTSVSIDFEQLIGEHTLVAAQTGFGKSVLLRKVLELALATNFPIWVLDSDGSFASLRDAAPNGLLVVGGDHGNPGVTVEATIRRLPQIVAARASVVLDIHGLDTNQQASIAAQALAAMMKLPETLQQPRLIVVDEVQRFAPQSGTSRAATPIATVAAEGRKRGLTLLVATQRLAGVSKALSSQMKNRLFGHMSDSVDRKRVAEELGQSRSMASALVEFDKGDFMIRGEAFGGSIDKVRIRKPITGTLGKDHMIEKLKLPVSPIEEVLALFGAAGMDATKAAAGVLASPPLTVVSKPVVVDLVPSLAFEAGEVSIETLLLEILAPFGRGGVETDSLALLAGATERRNAFQEAISSLLAGKLVSIGTGAKVRITPQGLAALGNERHSASTVEVLARLRASRDPVDERVVACLSAAGHAPLTAGEIQTRTGLGPRVLKAALKRLKRDCWVGERGGSFATSSGMARLIGVSIGRSAFHIHRQGSARPRAEPSSLVLACRNAVRLPGPLTVFVACKARSDPCHRRPDGRIATN